MRARTADIGRLAIIAGSGKLPVYLAKAAREEGIEPFIFAVEGDADQDWSGFGHLSFSIGDVTTFSAGIRQEKIDTVIMSGGIGRRPGLSELRPTWRTLRAVPGIVRTILSGGDDAMLRAAIGLIEGEGVRVIGAHEVAPDLLAETGPLGRVGPGKKDMDDIEAASAAALALGRLDIGQGAVAVGGRVIALEGLEGTDAMLERVAGLRTDGRLGRRGGGVLVKLCKPGQDLRADLPSIGVNTVEKAKMAGLAGIAVEAGRSLVLGRAEVIAAADSDGLFVTGIEPARQTS